MMSKVIDIISKNSQSGHNGAESAQKGQTDPQKL
jgi:hypothetical protein